MNQAYCPRILFLLACIGLALISCIVVNPIAKPNSTNPTVPNSHKITLENANSEIYLPELATNLLFERNLNSEQIAYLETHTFLENRNNQNLLGALPPSDLPQDIEPTSTTNSLDSESNELIIKGKTTFGELIEWGIASDDIEKVLGFSLPGSNSIAVKDFCIENGLSFESTNLEQESLANQLP